MEAPKLDGEEDGVEYLRWLSQRDRLTVIPRTVSWWIIILSSCKRIPSIDLPRKGALAAKYDEPSTMNYYSYSIDDSLDLVSCRWWYILTMAIRNCARFTFRWDSCENCRAVGVSIKAAPKSISNIQSASNGWLENCWIAAVQIQRDFSKFLWTEQSSSAYSECK